MKSGLRFLSAIGAALAATGLLFSVASADTENTNTNSQSGTNTATSTQSVAAISGDASATDNSLATSGDAVAEAGSEQVQVIVQRSANQIAVGSDACECFGLDTEGDIANTNSNSQAASNGGDSMQGAAAVSGTATAEDTSEAATGFSFAGSFSSQFQIQEQNSINQGLFSTEEAEEE